MCAFVVKMMDNVIVGMVTSASQYFRLVLHYIFVTVVMYQSYITFYLVSMQLKCVVFKGALDWCIGKLKECTRINLLA